MLLILDVSGQSQTVAAIARGFATHDPAVRIAGVVLNQVASERHERLARDAVEALGHPGGGGGASQPGHGAAGAAPGAGAGARACGAGGVHRAAGRRDGGVRRSRRGAGAGGAAGGGRRQRRGADPAAGAADRHRRGCGLQLRLSARGRGLAGGGGRARGLLAAGGRGAGRGLRCLLAAGGVSGAARRAAGGGGAVPRAGWRASRRRASRCTASAAGSWCWAGRSRMPRG